MARFSGENKVFKHKITVAIFSTAFARNVSHPKKTERNDIINVQYTVPYAKYGYSLLIVILICTSAQLFLLHKVIRRLHVSTNT